MNFKKSHIILLLVALLFGTEGCIEEIPLETESFESVLVVEATITDELKTQKIVLSRSYELEAEGPLIENNASIKVIGDDGSSYSFQQDNEGVYKSNVEFSAQENIVYHLEIRTSDGREYMSGNSNLSTKSIINDLYVERDFNENLEEGVSIYIDPLNTTNEQQLFRFEYEETYKIVAPRYSPVELIIQNDDFPYPPEVFFGFTARELVEFFVTKEVRTEQKRVCYNTVISNEVFIVNTADFEQNVLDKHRVRFISRLNYIMQHRYSILVRQFTQSIHSYEFYRTLRELSLSENIFSQVQPGFLQGNIIAKTGSNKKVAGFFEISSVDQRRVYFNYTDLFPGEELPPYFTLCDSFQVPPLYDSDPITNEIVGSPIQEEIKEGDTYFANNYEGDDIASSFAAPYVLTVAPSCGDCTVIGSTIVPDFWID